MAYDYSAKQVTIDGVVHDLTQPYILLMQHPLMPDLAAAGAQTRETLEACLGTGLRIFCFYPNADMGFREIIEVMERYGKGERIELIRFIERRDYLTLLANTSVLVGNTSSGILEAPSFRVPVVNVGERQRGRTRASNIIDVPQDRAAIAAALTRALHDEVLPALHSALLTLGPNPPPEAVAALTDAHRQIASLLRQSPPPANPRAELADGLGPALRRLVEEELRP